MADLAFRMSRIVEWPVEDERQDYGIEQFRNGHADSRRQHDVLRKVRCGMCFPQHRAGTLGLLPACEIKWCIGENLFSGWRDQSDEVFEENRDFLKNFEDLTVYSEFENSPDEGIPKEH